tara:strand:- start:916 stop:1368 length:453 start_codon:yes stop_codon:yes gene_type:complete
MSDFPFSIPSAHHAPTIFPIAFTPRANNGDLDGMMRIPHSSSPLDQNIFFTNIPFNYKVIGLTVSMDDDSGGGKDYDFTIHTRPKNSASTTGTAVGDTLSLDDVLASTSRSALFSNQQTISNEVDMGVHLNSNAANFSPEFIMTLYCQTV